MTINEASAEANKLSPALIDKLCNLFVEATGGDPQLAVVATAGTFFAWGIGALSALGASEQEVRDVFESTLASGAELLGDDAAPTP
jgi:hypothetical protein